MYMYTSLQKEGYVLTAFLWILMPFVKDQLRYAKPAYKISYGAWSKENRRIGQADAPCMMRIPANHETTMMPELLRELVLI